MKEYYTQSDLKEKGWTLTMIKSLLPSPILKQNPMYRTAAPMKLYDTSIVEAVMLTDDYTEALRKAQKRKLSARKATETKKENLKSEITDVICHISIKQIPKAELKHKVLCEREQYYRRRAEYYRYENDYYFETPDDSTFERWTVNYIRHNLCVYDHVLCRIHGKVGALEIYPDFKNAILDKIAEAYPAYAEECARQRV